MFDLARGPGRLHGRLIVSVQVARFGEPGVMEVWSDGPTDSAQDLSRFLLGQQYARFCASR